jgi:hypothetical protein
MKSTITVVHINAEGKFVSEEVSAESLFGTPKPAVRACGCNPDKFIRCEDHSRKMVEIHTAWYAASDRMARELWAHSDGYGEPGYIPCQGYDWSGIRDSSPEAIDAMHAVALRIIKRMKVKA